MTKTVPLPKVRLREINVQREQEALNAGLSPLIAKIVAGRPFLEESCPKELLAPKLKSLDNPENLTDMSKAVLRILTALQRQEIIGIETDHDCDGQTSHAVIYTALTEYFNHPKEKIRSYIGHRLKEGYGLSESVANRILNDSPKISLLITADNGSSDEIRIAQLKQAGIDVIVTDHHEIPQEGIPQSAYAVISPIRAESPYADRYIAGCMVAWLLMAATRTKLMELKGEAISSLAELLDFVAVGTIADCVSMARSQNNRAVVRYGMKLIQQALRPCWQALQPYLSSPVTSEDLGFLVGPLLNSDGRLSCAFGSVSFLLAQTLAEANEWIAYLQAQNAERKSIQDKITQLALIQAKKQFQAGKKSLCLFLEEGHAGVHGICASRIKDLFGRPVVILCPKMDDPTLLTGSARGIEGLNLRQALQSVHEFNPTLIERFGGHHGAAGLTLRRQQLEGFAEAFEQIIIKSIPNEKIGPTLLVDGPLPLDCLDLNYIQKLYADLEPFGREFEPPLFESTGKILDLAAMGKTQTHAKVSLVIEEMWLEAVWFNARETAEVSWPVAVGDQVKLALMLKIQTFRGRKKLACQIVHIQKASLKETLTKTETIDYVGELTS